MQYGHCLHTTVALGILFISIIFLEGEERQINRQSLSAHVAFYELMPLQECFEESTIYVSFPRPPSPPQPEVIQEDDPMPSDTWAEIGHLSAKLLPSLVYLKRRRGRTCAAATLGARSGDDLSRAVTEARFQTAGGPGGASVRQRMTQSSVATHPEPCLETLRQLATTGGTNGSR